jgi:FKBP-type peptidyl-prolyl cis-trans isomerase SlyD
MINVQIVSFHCVLKDKLGKVISSTYNRDVLTSVEASTEDKLPGLSKGLQNLKKGERREIVLSAAEAYGFYDINKVLDLSREDLRGANELKMGEKVLYATEGSKAQLYRVVNISNDRITLDSNHPLAGQDLVFEIEATDVREATADEIRESNSENTGITLH